MRMHNIHPRNRNNTIPRKSIDFQRISILFGLALAILAPTAYLIGIFYYNGFMNQFGLDSNYFPVSTQEIYIFAYQSFGLTLLNISTFIIKTGDALFIQNTTKTFFTLCFIFLTIYIALHHKAQRFILSTLSRIKDKLHQSRLHKNTFFKASGIFLLLINFFASIIYLLAAAGIFWWLIALISFENGTTSAKESMAPYEKYGCHYSKEKPWSNCTSIIENNKIILQGVLITENKERIAIFNKAGTQVISIHPNYTISKNIFPNR
ncbi:hypothetical protein VI06_15300 [Aquitalea magnusonii]|nr:hypothetical protein VI06_15300 [Aquitalea magnusonii]